MKYLKLSGILLLVVVGIGIIFSMVMPTKQRVQRSVIIQAPISNVYEQLARLEFFNTWSVWNKRDSVLALNYSGEEGTIGAAASWKGDPETSGEGKLVIADLQPNKKVVHNIYFILPKKAQAQSEFILTEVTGGTKLTWEFDLATPRPWNIFNLFSGIDKKMGKDFEEGLLNVKTSLEKKSQVVVAKSYDVMTMNFPATRFAQVRQQIKKSDIPSFFEKHFSFITAESEKANAVLGIPNGLFYVWDDENQQVDIAAAFPVAAGTKIDNTSIGLIDIPASKAVYVDYYGGFDKLEDAYKSIKKYLADNNLRQKPPAMEQYLINPGKEKDTTKWFTKVIFLVE